MRTLIILVIFVVTVPCVGACRAKAARAELQDDFRDEAADYLSFSTDSAVRIGRITPAEARQVRQVAEQEAAQLQLGQICRDREVRESAGCADWKALSWLWRGSLAVGALGIASLGLIPVVGFVAVRNRTTMARAFRPALYIVGALAVVLIAAHGVVAVATVWYGEQMLIGGVHPLLILAVAIGAAVGVIAVISELYSSVRTLTVPVVGVPVSRAEEPALWVTVESSGSSATASAKALPTWPWNSSKGSLCATG